MWAAAGEKNPTVWKLKHNVIEGINELLQEIDNYHAQVADQALQHIHQKYLPLLFLSDGAGAMLL